MNRWWTGYPAAEATIECRDDRHRLRWETGALRALDHDDTEGERTLAALGGERYTCIEILDAWHRHADDLRLLTLAGRGPTDPLAVQPPPAVFAGAPGVVGGGFVPLARRSHASAFAIPHTHGSAPSEQELIALLGLGGGLPQRLVATVAAEWTKRLTQRNDAVDRARPQLHAALYGRVLATLRSWLGDPAVDVALELVDEHEPPALSAHDGKPRARLPFSWLVTVWGRGLATVSGRFCLDAAGEDELRWTLTTVGPDFGEPRRMAIELSPP